LAVIVASQTARNTEKSGLPGTRGELQKLAEPNPVIHPNYRHREESFDASAL